jgi:hypothetical protein
MGYSGTIPFPGHHTGKDPITQPIINASGSLDEKQRVTIVVWISLSAIPMNILNKKSLTADKGLDEGLTTPYPKKVK